MAYNLRVHMAFFWFFLHSSVTNLCTLTWDRYIAIVHPFKYNTTMTKRRPGMVILMAWLIPFAISLLLCTAMKVSRLAGVTAFDIVSCVLLFYAVVCILVVARAHSHQEATIELQVQSNQSIDLHRCRQNNTARFIIAVVEFFLGCYVVVNYLVFCFRFSCHVMPDQASQVLTWFLESNSAVSPFVYALLKKVIKEQIGNLISSGYHRVRPSATATHISGAECNYNSVAMKKKNSRNKHLLRVLTAHVWYSHMSERT